LAQFCLPVKIEGLNSVNPIENPLSPIPDVLLTKSFILHRKTPAPFINLSENKTWFCCVVVAVAIFETTISVPDKSLINILLDVLARLGTKSNNILLKFLSSLHIYLQ